jgi:hypothetical protein
VTHNPGEGLIPDAAERLAAELYHSEFRGWRDGAGIRAMDPKFTEHPTRPDLKAAYELGYRRGTEDRREMSKTIASKYSYEPTILRAEKPL